MPGRPLGKSSTAPPVTAPTAGRTPPPPLRGPALADALVALHHPARRRLYEVLTTGGPATVGQLARRTGLAVGSVSHHLKALHRAGFVEPAGDLARDSRQSWWRGVRRRLSWSVDDFAPGTAGRAVAEVAEQANLEHLHRVTLAWLHGREGLDEPWRSLYHATDDLVPATAEQVEQVATEVERLVRTWDAACRADALARPDADRRPVRIVARVFPSDPGAP